MECICLLFLYIVNKQQWRHFGKGTQCGKEEFKALISYSCLAIYYFFGFN
jgi:hypothetical protein